MLDRWFNVDCNFMLFPQRTCYVGGKQDDLYLYTNKEIDITHATIYISIRFSRRILQL